MSVPDRPLIKTPTKEESDEIHVVAVLPGHVEAVVVSGSVELGEDVSSH
jgi:hypothetical protein